MQKVGWHRNLFINSLWFRFHRKVVCRLAVTLIILQGAGKIDMIARRYLWEAFCLVETVFTIKFCSFVLLQWFFLSSVQPKFCSQIKLFFESRWLLSHIGWWCKLQQIRRIWLLNKSYVVLFDVGSDVVLTPVWGVMMAFLVLTSVSMIVV